MLPQLSHEEFMLVSRAKQLLHWYTSNAFCSYCGSKNNFEVKHYDYSAKNIRKSIENSLNNLNTEYIDIFLFFELSVMTNLQKSENLKLLRI